MRARLGLAFAAGIVISLIPVITSRDASDGGKALYTAADVAEALQERGLSYASRGPSSDCWGRGDSGPASYAGNGAAS